MQRAEHQVTCVGRLNGNFGCFSIANLTHHNHIGILTQKVAQNMGKRTANVVFHRHLINSRHLIFHRVFHGHDPFISVINRI